MSDLPEIQEIRRLAIRPGDRLVVRAAAPISADQAHAIRERVRAVLDLPPDIPVLAIGAGDDISVISSE